MGKLPVINHTIDPMNPMRPSVTGPFCETVVVNGQERRYISYAPEGVRSATAGIFVLPDDGVSAQELYENGNWAELAETDERKEKFVVFFLEPVGGKWGIDSPEDDLRYVREVFQASTAREKFSVHEAKNYLVGYGIGGTMAQMAAMDNPAVYAGIATVDAPDVSEEYIRTTAEAPCTSLFLFEDTDNRYGMKKKDLTVPAWIITSHPISQTADSAAARHWRACSETVAQPRQLRPDTVEYYRTKDAPWTVNQEKEAFRVWISQIPDAAKNYGNGINRRIWSEFLRNVRRWGAEPGGDLRMTKDPVIDLHMDYYYEEIDGWMREYYVYVPERLKQECRNKVPLVIACHGYACSGEIYTGNSEWHKVAEDNGFLVVFPSAVHGYLRSSTPSPAVGDHDTELPAWNLLDMCDVAPNELTFFEEMIENVCSSYPVDRQRVFITGHSLGSLMAQYMGMARPDLFAAIAPCSGVLFLDAAKRFPTKPEIVNRPEGFPLPVWMFGGEREEWLLDAVPTPDNQTGKSIHIWWDFNRMTGDKPVDFEAARGPENGRWKDYLFLDKQIPMIRYTWVEAMPHATMTEMSYRIWDEFFSKICRNERGEIEYHDV